MKRGFAGLCLALLAGCALAASPLEVRIPTANLSSAPEALHAQLFLPATPGPHPAVVMLHGCGGAYTKSGKLSSRHQMWGDFLAANGYAALMLDSLTARGIKSLCTQKFSERTLKERHRRGDAYAALAWLRQQDGIDPERIGLLGWSHGGGVTLDAITHPAEGLEGFRLAVSFYPGCSSKAKKADSFHPYAPTLLIIGEADDWTPAAPCKTLAAAVAERGEAMQIVSYPDTFHDFDNPGLTQKRVRKDVPNGVNPGQGTTIAPNPEAREDAKRRVLEFFAEHLQ